MILHGDDIYNYTDIRYNLSSNVYNGFDHSGLYQYLAMAMPCITNYPEPTPHCLEQMIASRHDVSADNVMVTNGATEAIYLIAQAYHGCRSRVFNPAFGEYAEACRIHNHVMVDSGEDVAWICNPNNPTGKVMPKDELLNAIRQSPSAVYVIDQSYERFTIREMLSSRDAVALPNALVLHSMTKEYAVPGLRLGYVVGNRQLLDRIRQYRMPWSVNALAIEAGRYLLEHDDDYAIEVGMLLDESQRVATSLRQKGIHVTPSDTHILLCQLPPEGIVITGKKVNTAAELKTLLATRHGILIRDATNFDTLTPRHFRIAVQNKQIDDVFLSAMS